LVSKFTFPAPDTSVKTEERTIDGDVKVRIYTPPGYVNGSKPIGVFIHGGGWAMGDLDADDATVRPMSKGAGVVIVSVDYRLAPQHPYPAGLDDLVTAFKWTIKNAEQLGGVSGKAFIGGISAGGGSAFGLALKLLDEGLIGQVVGIVAQMPVTVHPDVVPAKYKSKYTSYDENEDATINTKTAMYGFFGTYNC
jgi:versiconal hemiacetal acetate esterase